MNKSSTLTCIVSTYNSAHFIKKCVDSLLMQETKYSFDILIIDDCSTDNTREVVLELQKNNSKNNLYFFSTRENTGLGKKALKEVEPNIKRFLDSDYLIE